MEALRQGSSSILKHFTEEQVAATTCSFEFGLLVLPQVPSVEIDHPKGRDSQNFALNPESSPLAFPPACALCS